MNAAEWFCIAWGALNIVLLGLLVWGDWRADRYYDALERRIQGAAPVRDERTS